MAVMRSDEIGGGIVRRVFRNGDVQSIPGKRMTGDEVRAMRNHRQLIDKGFVDVWPKGGDAGEVTRLMYFRAPKGFTVIEGRDIKVLAENLSKDEAEALMGSGAAVKN